MLKKRTLIVALVLALALVLGLSACKQAATPTQQAAPAEQMGYSEALTKAMEAARAGDAEGAKTALQAALEAAQFDADKAFVNELLEDVEKGALDEVVEDIAAYLGMGEAPGFIVLLEKAMDAAKAGDAEKTREELNEALELAETDAQRAMVEELLADVDKGDLDEVAEDIERYLEQQQSALGSDEVAKAKQLYTQLGCFACHGMNFEGNQGPIIVGLPVQTIENMVRNGAPDGEMPAFGQNAISDADIELLAKFFNSLTIADTAVVIPDEVKTHLDMAL